MLQYDQNTATNEWFSAPAPQAAAAQGALLLSLSLSLSLARARARFTTVASVWTRTRARHPLMCCAPPAGPRSAVGSSSNVLQDDGELIMYWFDLHEEKYADPGRTWLSPSQ
jgi:hypothetical protein